MKAVFFDLDGTLTDSGEGIINCAILALEHFGLPIPSREALRVFVGPPLDQSFINHGVPADKTDEAIREQGRWYPFGEWHKTGSTPKAHDLRSIGDFWNTAHEGGTDARHEDVFLP